MNNISARDSLPGRCLVCSDGINRWASQSANALQKSSRQQYSAVISTAIEGTLRNRVCGSVFANRSCQTFDSFGIPSTLIRSSGVIVSGWRSGIKRCPKKRIIAGGGEVERPSHNRQNRDRHQDV